ncbi:MAG: carboxypeptidase regulatory-like domain-containing protein [Deltaproteobacteria bacterium]|nr:carboxypeptidase regulatory-like domain-containing protein [Deltaproteobacteria bacterium]
MLRASPGEPREDPSARQGSLEGLVVSALDGRGVPGATLSFVQDAMALAVTTGPDGAFVFAPGRPGALSLALVTARGFHPWEATADTVRYQAVPGVRVGGVRIALQPRVEYTIRVLGTGRQPLVGARVRALSGDAPEALTDARGEASLEAPDDALVEALAEGYAPGRGRVDLAAQTSHLVELRLQPGERGPGQGLTTLSGRVEDPSGEALDGVEVSARCAFPPASPEAERSPTVRGRTTPDGRFTLEGLDRCTLRVRASDGEHAPAEREVAPGTSEVLLRLTAGAALRGRVVRASGAAPVTAFSVVLWPLRGALERGPSRVQGVFHPEGRFELRGLAPGPHRVTAVAYGQAPAPELTVTLTLESPTDVTLQVGEGGNITGRVLSDGRGPLEGARVSLESVLGGGDQPVSVGLDGRTDARGMFTLSGLGSGLRSVLVAAEGHHARILSGLEVRDGAVTGPVEVTLTRVGPEELPRLELVGIGAVLSARGDVLVLGQVLPGGGAEEAGLVPGDLVLTVDGAPVAGLGFEGAIQRIRGPEGSVVRLGLRRGDAGATVREVRRRRVLR